MDKLVNNVKQSYLRCKNNLEKNDKLTKNVAGSTKVENFVSKGKEVKATYKALHYGTPSWADFKGVHGAMYVLLKK